ncbi:hypothetical protein [Actinacidiphila sp. bgisy160]
MSRRPEVTSSAPAEQLDQQHLDVAQEYVRQRQYADAVGVRRSRQA